MGAGDKAHCINSERPAGSLPRFAEQDYVAKELRKNSKKAKTRAMLRDRGRGFKVYDKQGARTKGSGYRNSRDQLLNTQLAGESVRFRQFGELGVRVISSLLAR